MNPLFGIFKPNQFFLSNLSLSSKQLAASLINRIIFLTLFSSILAYMIEMNVKEVYGEYAFSSNATQSAIGAAIWVVSTFIVYGMVAAVLGKMFSVTEKPVAIVTNTFWGQLYGIILGFFASMLVVIFSLQFLTSVESLLSVEFLLPPLMTFFAIKAIYAYLAIKTSMQTTVGETVFLLTLTHLLNSVILACLLGLLKMLG